MSEEDQAALYARSLGLSDDDHAVPPIVRRGRAAAANIGVQATAADLPPELTSPPTAPDGAPFGPTIRDGVLHICRYLGLLQVRHRDFNGRVLTIHEEDLKVLALMLETMPARLQRRLGQSLFAPTRTVRDEPVPSALWPN